MNDNIELRNQREKQILLWYFSSYKYLLKADWKRNSWPGSMQIENNWAKVMALSQS